MNKNKTLVLGTVLAAAGVGVVAGQSEAHADSVYTVQKGDTIYKISRKFAGDTSLVKDIVKVNKLSNPDLIYVGQKVTVPTKGETTQARVASKPTTYVAPKTQKTVKTTYQAPKAQKQTYVAPKQQATQVTKPVQKQQTNTYVAPKAQKQTTYVAKKATPKQSNLSSSEASAKSWIAMKESTNNYNARNGQYIGKYQLTASYLNGDYSPANQERVAEKYVKERYGSWSAAKAFHQANGWY